MSIFRDLLFLHGHIADVELARSLAGADAPAGAPDEPPAASPAMPSQGRRHAPPVHPGLATPLRG